MIGASADDTLGIAIVDAVGAAARFCSGLSAPEGVRPDLAVVVHQVGVENGLLAVDLWGQRMGIPILHVALGSQEAVIGPLTRPGTAGCGECARRRMEAVARAVPAEDGPVGEAMASDVSLRCIADAVRMSLHLGIEASPFWGHVVVVDDSTGAASLHRIVPLGVCPVCGGASSRPLPDAGDVAPLSADDPPGVVLEALAGWVDPRTGVIPRLVVERNAPGSATVPVVVTAAPPHIVDDDGTLRRFPIGWGKGLTLSQAILSAVGEAIERYAASQVDPSRIVWARPDELEGDRLDPRRFALYSQDQYERAGFPYAPFNPAVSHPWVGGRWLDAESPVWVPAIFAFLSFTLRSDQLLCQGTSNGLAAASDFAKAALAATMELVERDAFMAAWLTGRPGRRVLDVALDCELREVIAAVDGLGCTVEVYLLPTSAVGTTALCLSLGDGQRWPGITLGLGADLDPRVAVRQAVLELAQTGPHLARLLQTRAVRIPDGPRAVRTMLDHAAYYLPMGRATSFDRLRVGATRVARLDPGPNAPDPSLATCASLLGAAGIRVALVDVTSPDVATGPFWVVRAVSADLQPISYGYGLDRPPVKRIQALGLASETPSIHPIW